jgi:chromate transporter
MQSAVAALIVRAIYRISGPALNNDIWLFGIAFLAGIAQLMGLNFLIILLIAGTIFTLYRHRKTQLAFGLGLKFIIWIALSKLQFVSLPFVQPTSASSITPLVKPLLINLMLSGLRAGLLTFGGAYTVIPFLQHDAVQIGKWLTNAQFLNGLALSGLLPAPLIIFSTFIGYLGGGIWGAIVITIGIFSPSFAFTMIGHDLIEQLIEKTAVHAFLDGVTAGVIGLVSATAVGILRETLTGIHSWVIFALALSALFVTKAKWSVAVVILGAGIYGLLFLRGL